MGNGSLNEYKPKETAIIILGDCGFNFFLNEYDKRTKSDVNETGYRFYCVRGNHEARPQDIKGMKRMYDNDVNGDVYYQEEYPNIRYFLDYGTYKISSYKVAVIGGAYSVDKWYRLRRAGVRDKLNKDYFNARRTGWFYNEQLTEEEMYFAEKLFEGQKFDFVFSHTCPIDWQPTDLFLSVINQSEVDNTMELWMNDLKDKISWGIWLFGHYHRDRLERPYVEMYFNDIENLDTIKARWDKYDVTGEFDWFLDKSPNFYMT